MGFRQGCQVTTDVAPETATNAQHYSLNSNENSKPDTAIIIFGFRLVYQV